jgi:hypothetical protein
MTRLPEDELNQIESRMDANDIPRLVSELRRVYGISHESRVDRARRLVELLLPQTVAYHNHKETMAHAGVALEMALFVAIMSLNPWPPSWVPDIRLSARLVTFLAFVLIWLLIHIFIRWELRGRRSAALHHAGLLRILRKWINEPPTEEDLQPYRGDSASHSKAKTLLDFLFPYPSANIPPDEEDEGYPTSIVKEWQSQKTKGTGAFRSEVFLFIGSGVIFILVCLRTFWGK